MSRRGLSDDGRVFEARKMLDSLLFFSSRDDAYQHYDMPYNGGRGGGPGQMQMGGHNRHPWGHGATPEMGSIPPHQDFTVTVAPNR